MRRSFYVLLGCILLCSLVSGCGGGGGPKTYPVKGTVTLNGQPLANVQVTFFPTQGRPAAGLTDDQGVFYLTSYQPKDGALAGAYNVSITEPPEENMPMPGTGPEPTPKPPRFAARYSDKNESKFTAEVKPGAENDFKFDLTE